MARNIIKDRVLAFLKLYPPFNLVDVKALSELSDEVLITFFTKGALIFAEGTQPHNGFYIVRKGSVLLHHRQELLDHCDEGDIFGIRSLIVGKPYIASATCDEDSVIYQIPNEVFQKYALEYPHLLMYFTAGFAAGKTIFRTEKEGQHALNDLALASYGQQSLEGLKRLPAKDRKVVISPTATIKEAATVMTEEKVGSIVIVDKKLYPVGIITDRDLRTKVVTGQYSIEQEVSTIMSSPVQCIEPEPTINDVMISFLKENYNHICVTQDGSPHSPLVTVISDQDVLVEQGNNPAFLLKRIKRANSIESLRHVRNRIEDLIKDYLENDVSVAFVADLTATLEESILEKIFSFALKEMKDEGSGKPPCDFCWLALGSQGRREQLLRTDQDNAMLYAEDGKNNKAYFLGLSQKVNQKIHQIGFELCPAEIMGSNPDWCMSLVAWEKAFSNWINSSSTEGILHSTIFFDFSPVFGNADLADRLAQHVINESDNNQIFLSKLAINALSSPPPLSFFRNMVLEKSGEHKNQFDIKARALVPLADIARLFTIYHKITQVNNTYERLETIAKYEKDSSLFQDAAIAYKFLMKIRTLRGIEENSNGRFIAPEKLKKLRRQVLKNIFDTISELHAIIKVRFRTSMLS